ncbi:MAG: dihydrodipicolinate synthase family protein [Owenweeksia sp.]|nr:dihydrodipicolinate synthase family protein [Owenweeksia sp.]
MQNLTGTGVALITPFDQYEKIDHQGIENLVNHCVAGGVDYLVVMGTTGENPTLTVSEKVEMLQSVQRVNDSRLPIVYGIGGNNTAGLHQTINDTDFSDIDAILSVSPYYNKPTQEGLYQHYKTLSEAAPVPVIIYNVPGRTGSNITAETTLRLARNCENIIG